MHRPARDQLEFEIAGQIKMRDGASVQLAVYPMPQSLLVFSPLDKDGKKKGRNASSQLYVLPL
jgi:hypothetical protein